MVNYSVYVTGYGFNNLPDIDQSVLLQVDRQSCQSEESRTDYRVLTAEDLEYAISQLLDEAKTEAVDYYKDCENVNGFR